MTLETSYLHPYDGQLERALRLKALSHGHFLVSFIGILPQVRVAECASNHTRKRGCRHPHKSKQTRWTVSTGDALHELYLFFTLWLIFRKNK